MNAKAAQVTAIGRVDTAPIATARVDVAELVTLEAVQEAARTHFLV